VQCDFGHDSTDLEDVFNDKIIDKIMKKLRGILHYIYLLQSSIEYLSHIEPLSTDRYDVPLKCIISTQEQNCGPPEEFAKRLIHPDKYLLRQYLVDESDPELRRILHLMRHQNRAFRDSEDIDRKSIGLYLNRKGWTTRVIHDDLADALGEEAIAYRIVTKYLREARAGHEHATQFSEEISSHMEDSDEVILSALEEYPFSLVRKLLRATHLSVTMTYRRLSEKFWFPADNQKAIWVQCSQSLLTILLEQHTRARHDFATLDESWFDYITDYELILLPHDGKIPDREPFTIESRK
jgi:hypothetical protein